jgi:hypothetical protein
MSKSLIQKYNEELKKLGLEFEVTRECNDKFIGNVLENGIVRLNKWSVLKCLQWKSVKSFALMTKDNVEMHKKYEEMTNGKK